MTEMVSAYAQTQCKYWRMRIKLLQSQSSRLALVSGCAEQVGIASLDYTPYPPNIYKTLCVYYVLHQFMLM